MCRLIDDMAIYITLSPDTCIGYSCVFMSLIYFIFDIYFKVAERCFVIKFLEDWHIYFSPLQVTMLQRAVAKW